MTIWIRLETSLEIIETYATVCNFSRTFRFWAFSFDWEGVSDMQIEVRA